MKKRKQKPKPKESKDMKDKTKRRGWEIVKLPNGSFQWIVR